MYIYTGIYFKNFHYKSIPGSEIKSSKQRKNVQGTWVIKVNKKLLIYFSDSKCIFLPTTEACRIFFTDEFPI